MGDIRLPDGHFGLPVELHSDAHGTLMEEHRTLMRDMREDGGPHGHYSPMTPLYSSILTHRPAHVPQIPKVDQQTRRADVTRTRIEANAWTDEEL